MTLTPEQKDGQLQKVREIFDKLAAGDGKVSKNEFIEAFVRERSQIKAEIDFRMNYIRECEQNIQKIN